MRETVMTFIIRGVSTCHDRLGVSPSAPKILLIATFLQTVSSTTTIAGAGHRGQFLPSCASRCSTTFSRETTKALKFSLLSSSHKLRP